MSSFPLFLRVFYLSFYTSSQLEPSTYRLTCSTSAFWQWYPSLQQHQHCPPSFSRCEGQWIREKNVNDKHKCKHLEKNWHFILNVSFSLNSWCELTSATGVTSNGPHRPTDRSADSDASCGSGCQGEPAAARTTPAAAATPDSETTPLRWVPEAAWKPHPATPSPARGPPQGTSAQSSSNPAKALIKEWGWRGG